MSQPNNHKIPKVTFQIFMPQGTSACIEKSFIFFNKKKTSFNKNKTIFLRPSTVFWLFDEDLAENRYRKSISTWNTRNRCT